MRPIRVFILSCLVIVFAAMTADADPTSIATPSPSLSQSQPQQLPPVVVTATRIEQPVSEIGTSVTVVERGQMQSQQIQSVVNVLEQVPGVTVMQTGSPGTVSEVFIRGADPTQTLMLL